VRQGHEKLDVVAGLDILVPHAEAGEEGVDAGEGFLLLPRAQPPRPDLRLQEPAEPVDAVDLHVDAPHDEEHRSLALAHERREAQGPLEEPDRLPRFSGGDLGLLVDLRLAPERSLLGAEDAPVVFDPDPQDRVLPRVDRAPAPRAEQVVAVVLGKAAGELPELPELSQNRRWIVEMGFFFNFEIHANVLHLRRFIIIIHMGLKFKGGRDQETILPLPGASNE
jgi:hypothetical protein